MEFSVRKTRSWVRAIIWVTFLTSRKCSGSFWSSRSYILTSDFRDIRSSGVRTFLTDSRHGNLNFCRIIYFRFLSGFYFRSHFYIRDSGGTTASPCAWPDDNGRGRFYATYVTRICHHGRRISFPGRRHRSRLAWQVAATYVTWRRGFHDFTRNTSLCHLLDWKSTRIATKAAILPPIKFDANSTSKRWENFLKRELLLPLTEVAVEN